MHLFNLPRFSGRNAVDPEMVKSLLGSVRPAVSATPAPIAARKALALN